MLRQSRDFRGYLLRFSEEGGNEFGGFDGGFLFVWDWYVCVDFKDGHFEAWDGGWRMEGWATGDGDGGEGIRDGVRYPS